MGLFDGLKLAADLVKGGIAAFKATEKLDALTDRSQTEFKAKLNDEEKRLYTRYVQLKEKQEKEADQDKSTELMDQAEAAQCAYLGALAADGSFPQTYRAEIVLALEEYRRTNDDMPVEMVEKFIMSQAKTEEEKEAARQILDEARAEFEKEEKKKKEKNNA